MTSIQQSIMKLSSNKNTENKPLVGILGHGEIGSSLHKVYDLVSYKNVVVRDPYAGINNSLSKCDMINVCIPFFGYDKFVTALKELNLKSGCIIIIQSTIGLGTTDKVQADGLSLPAEQLSRYLLGVYNRATFGKVTASIASQLNLPNSLVAVENTYGADTRVVSTIDSVILEIPYPATLLAAKSNADFTIDDIYFNIIQS